MSIGVSRAPYAPFKNAGDKCGGEIVDFRVVQKTDIQTKQPMYFERNDEGKASKSFRPFAPDGRPNDPITHWEITVETGVEDEDGDTERRIIVDPRRGMRGTATEGKRGLDAVSKALKQAKAHRVGLEIGGELTVTFLGKVRVGTDPETGTWSAEYEPPVGGPGSGKAVDETPWLVGGARYDKAAELAKWEASKAAGTAPALVSAPVDAELAERRREASDRLARAHESSPVLAGRRRSEDDEAPF